MNCKEVVKTKSQRPEWYLASLYILKVPSGKLNFKSESLTELFT